METNRNTKLAIFDLFAGLLAGSAIIQTASSFSQINPDFSYPNFFSYFTIQSNIISTLFFLACAFQRFKRGSISDLLQKFRPMLILWMSMTTFVYWIVLHKAFIAWLKITPEDLSYYSNIVNHSWAFIALMIQINLDKPRFYSPKSNAWLFLTYPILYGIYTSIRGLYTDWYPYPFTNPHKLGSHLNVLFAYIAMCFVYYWLARLVLVLNNRLAQHKAG